tara:strand:- start:5506 stop:5787 length:282 start_codon:yes stop_codon:yes gene_type:complete
MLLVYNRKKRLTKKQKLQTVELPSDYNLGVELVRQLEVVKKTKKPIRCKVDNGWNSEDWLVHCFPEWQQIWTKKNVEIKWHGGYRAFFLRYIK